MSIKVVMVFQQSTIKGKSDPAIGLAGREHIGGWTEHVWWQSDSVDNLMKTLLGDFGVPNPLLPARANLLAESADILGVRLYQGGAGKGQFRSAAFPGAFSDTEIPQMSILCSIPMSNSTVTRRYILRGVPDGQVIGGEFNPSLQYSQALQTFFESLTQFGAMGADTVPTVPIFQITPQGVVTLNGVNNPFLVQQVVTFRNVVDLQGNRKGGKFLVTAVGPMNNQFTIQGWPFGTCTGGDARVPTKSVKAMVAEGASVSRVITRRVGRPFELYRGRRSKRKRVA